jgi:hypothetical protein
LAAAVGQQHPSVHVVVAQELDGGVGIGGDPVGVDHVLEQRAVEHRGLFVEPEADEFDVGAERRVRAGEQRDEQHVGLWLVAKFAASPRRRHADGEALQSIAGGETTRQLLGDRCRDIRSLGVGVHAGDATEADPASSKTDRSRSTRSACSAPAEGLVGGLDGGPEGMGLGTRSGTRA